MIVTACAVALVLTDSPAHNPSPTAPPAKEVRWPPLVGQTVNASRASGVRLPLSFEANRGQAHPAVDFLSRSPGSAVFLSAGELVLVKDGPSVPAGPPGSVGLPGVAGRGDTVLRMALTGANASPRVTASRRLAGEANYIIGADSSRWARSIPTYQRVTYDEVYPGIDLVFHWEPEGLEFDFVVAPGADPDLIRFGWSGLNGLDVDRGDLVLDAPLGTIRQAEPFIYQEAKTSRREIPGGYRIDGDSQVSFSVGDYDHKAPLVIDPVIPWSTYLGGTRSDVANAVAVDKKGNTYVAGWTGSIDFPEEGGLESRGERTACELHGDRPPELLASECGDAFVAKIDPTGSRLVYSTYLGGSGADVANAIAVDDAGNAHLTGTTGPGGESQESPRPADFPTTENAYQRAHRGQRGDAFVVKLDANGSALLYSSYLGGPLPDEGRAIALDGAGSLYLTGSAFPGFPTKNAFQPAAAGDGTDAFVAKINPSLSGGDSLVYATYLGGDGLDSGRGIAVDGPGNAYVTGSASPAFPTKNGFQPVTPGGSSDAFVARLNPALSGRDSLVYASYLGGPGADTGNAIALGSSGEVYAVGAADAGLPTTEGSFQPDSAGKGPTDIGRSDDAFLAELDTAASGAASLKYVTYLGGAGRDSANAVAVDPSGAAYVTGATLSADFPTRDAFQVEKEGTADAFVAKVTLTGRGTRDLVYSTFIGGGGRDRDTGLGVAVDGSGAAHVVGLTEASSDFPTMGPLQALGTGRAEAFVAKIDQVAANAPVVTRMEPRSGPTAGGTKVVITGRRLANPTAVRFGEVPAPDYSVNEAGTRLSVVAPAHKQGSVVVSVVTPGASSGPVPGAKFVFGRGGWTKIGATNRANHTATLLRSGAVLVAGGCMKPGENGACTSPSSSVELYDPASRTWSATSKMTAGRAGHTATLLADGKVLVVGGTTIPGLGAEVYDPKSRTWARAGTEVPERPYGHTATLLRNGQVLLTGGTVSAAGKPEATAHLYDPSTTAWSSATDMAMPRAYHTATRLPSGKVLVVGGTAAPGSAYVGAELYDPAGRSWAGAGGGDPVARARHTATLLPNGQVLVAGGVDAVALAPALTLASAEIYSFGEPAGTGADSGPAWQPTESLPAGRYSHTATLLKSGVVLVTGGSDTVSGGLSPGNRLATATLYEPRSRRWATAGMMSVGHGGGSTAGAPAFTSTLLGSGDVLVVGGRGAKAVEIYSPQGETLEAKPSADNGSSSALPAALAAVAGLALVVVVARRRRRRG